MARVYAFPGCQKYTQKRVIDAEAYLYLVHRIAKRVSKRVPMSVDFDDLIGAGTVGLMDAIEKYDWEKCDKFEPYAEIRIKGAIIDQLRAMDWVPRSVRKKANLVENARHEMTQILGREPDDSEMSRHLGMQEQAFRALLREAKAAAKHIRLDAANDGVRSLMVGYGDRKNAEEAVQKEEEKLILAQAIAELDDRAQKMLNLYFVDHLDLKSIGELFGISESRVCQINTQSMKTIRQRIRNGRYQSMAIQRKFTRNNMRDVNRNSSKYKLLRAL